jgi:hypothetical protein
MGLLIKPTNASEELINHVIDNLNAHIDMNRLGHSTSYHTIYEEEGHSPTIVFSFINVRCKEEAQALARLIAETATKFIENTVGEKATIFNGPSSGNA